MSNLAKSVVIHVKYPYTAGVIAIIWVGMAVILAFSGGVNFEILILATVVVSLIITAIGFGAPKK